jgi:hypothetical protein
MPHESPTPGCTPEQQRDAALYEYSGISNALQPWSDTQDHSNDELARYCAAWNEFAVGMAKLANDAGQFI